jgi:tRNA-Thr(GGU) m(6)t(6)A37 methyltransferase TsaA
MTICFTPIGTIRSGYHDTAQIPKGVGAQHEAVGTIEIRDDLAEGLADIDGFSHLYVLWVFDRQKEVRLTVTPPNDDRAHGVLATRAPVRPNPIGLTVVELLGRDGCRLHVRGVDMLDGTPVLDIKPYLSSVPPERLRRGWLDDAEARRAAGASGAPDPKPEARLDASTCPGVFPMVISRDRYLDDTSRYHVTIALATRTGELHSLMSALPPDVLERVGRALVKALDEVQAALAPPVATTQPASAPSRLLP